MAKIERTNGGARGRSKTVEHRGLLWTVATGPGGTVAEQTRTTLAKLEASLLEAGSDKHHILEAVVYLADMATKQEMDEVWCGWIPDDGWPCRACVGTDLHAGDLVEIKLTATRPDLD
jgi:enamine deaminase RidA (YjgF/YER057c/UK114 family)